MFDGRQGMTTLSLPPTIPQRDAITEGAAGFKQFVGELQLEFEEEGANV